MSEECRVRRPGSIPSPKLFHRELIPNPDTSCHVRFKSLPFHAHYSSANAKTRQWTCTTLNILVSGLDSDKSSSLCGGTGSSGCQQVPLGTACHKPQLLSCTALFTGATAPLALPPAAVGHAFLPALWQQAHSSLKAPAKSVRSLVGSLGGYYR